MLHELPMVFTSDGVPLAGIFVRSSASLSERQRCVVVTGSWLNVKEQMALVYARALAERGFTAFTYDFSGWGASGGALRHWEMPTQKARDMGAAVDFVSSLSLAGPKVGYLAVYSDGCALPDNAKAVHARLAGEKELAWIDKGTQSDFYDVPEYVNTAADRAAAWFEETL